MSLALDYNEIVRTHLSRLYQRVRELTTDNVMTRIILKVIVSSIITFARQTFTEESAMKQRAKELAYEIQTARRMLSLNCSYSTIHEIYDELMSNNAVIPSNHIKFFTSELDELLIELKRDHSIAIADITFSFLSMGDEFKPYMINSSVITSKELFILYFYTMESEKSNN